MFGWHKYDQNGQNKDTADTKCLKTTLEEQHLKVNFNMILGIFWGLKESFEGYLTTKPFRPNIEGCLRLNKNHDLLPG